MACGERIKDIDDYIAKAEDFAKPIFAHLRDLIHESCPEIEEKVRWGMPHFDHKGMICHLASFKKHCSVGFWKQSIMKDPQDLFAESDDGMGSLGKITQMSDLPSKTVLKAYIKEAVRLNEEGIKVPKKKPAPKKEAEIPDYFAAELAKHKTAKKTFGAFSPSHKFEYIEWITEAKQEVTRKKRMRTAIDWLSEGKSLNWKYMRKG